MTPLVVPGASVILKWALQAPDEPHADRALALRDAWRDGACEIVVPVLWTFEVANVLGRREPARAADLLAALTALGMPEAPPAPYAGDMLRLMRAHGVTAYDAAYHALARARGGTMITADRRYMRQASGAGHVRLLDDWSI